MFFKKKKEDYSNSELIDYCNRSIRIEEDNEKNIIKNCNGILTSNSIILIPLVTGLIECLVRLEKVRTLIIIFGLILIGLVLVSNFFAILAGKIYKTSGKKSLLLYDEEDYIDELNITYENKYKSNEIRSNLLLVSHIIIYSFYVLLFIFGMVIMICL